MNGSELPLGSGCFLGLGFRFAEGSCLFDAFVLSLGLRALAGCVPLISINPLLDGGCHHHRANNNHCTDDDLGCREDTEGHDCGSGCIRVGDSASFGDIPKPDPVAIESVKAPLRQDRPFVGGFAHHAMPVIRPGVLRRPLKVGESRTRGLGSSSSPGLGSIVAQAESRSRSRGALQVRERMATSFQSSEVLRVKPMLLSTPVAHLRHPLIKVRSSRGRRAARRRVGRSAPPADAGGARACWGWPGSTCSLGETASRYDA